MNLKGQKVKHKINGVGTIIGQDEEGRLIIEFKDKTAKFKYPDAFEAFLVAEDVTLQEEIKSEIEAKKAATMALKAAKQKEAESERRETEARQSNPRNEKKQRMIKRADGQPLTYFVFMGPYFEPEVERGLIWTPYYDAGGNSKFTWDNIENIRKGDILLHDSAGCIKAISIAKDSFKDCANPLLEQGADPIYTKGRKVDCDYTVLKNPIATSDFHDEIIKYCQVKYSPFDKDGNGNLGYLYDIDVKLMSIFVKAIVEKNEEVKNLDYVQWLLDIE